MVPAWDKSQKSKVRSPKQKAEGDFHSADATYLPQACSEGRVCAMKMVRKNGVELEGINGRGSRTEVQEETGRMAE